LWNATACPQPVYVTIAVELLGGAALILGILPRYVALLLIPEIIGTIITVHGKNGWEFNNNAGGWEYPAFWAAALLVQFLLGDGALALVPSPRFFRKVKIGFLLAARGAHLHQVCGGPRSA
jgi:uncharacterized membrane protein YphA (DoxX/SURF4 family)